MPAPIDGPGVGACTGGGAGTAGATDDDPRSGVGGGSISRADFVMLRRLSGAGAASSGWESLLTATFHPGSMGQLDARLSHALDLASATFPRRDRYPLRSLVRGAYDGHGEALWARERRTPARTTSGPLAALPLVRELAEGAISGRDASMLPKHNPSARYRVSSTRVYGSRTQEGCRRTRGTS